MATGLLSSAGSKSRQALAWSPGAVVVALALPILFLHVRYQPGFSVHVGSTAATAYLADIAVWVIVLAALVEGVRHGWAPLRPGRPLWAAGLAFFAWLGIGLLLGAHRTPGYDWHVHGVTAAKFFEYALLAPALPLLLRRRADLTPAFGMLTLWSVVATTVGVAQFFGAQIFLSGAVGRRQASFLSSLDLAALSAATLLAGAAALALGRGNRRIAWVALVSGTLGTVVGGSMSAVLGVLGGAAVLAVAAAQQHRLRRRSTLAVGVALVLLVGGALAIRSSDLDAFARFIGSNTKQTQPATKVQTYAHRTLLVWLGYEIWTDHPLLGSGFEASAEPGAFEPHLPAAHRRFPDEAPLAFPTRDPDRRYGVQNLYVQTLADLGVVGFALLAALLAAAAFIAWRAARRGIALGTVALAWLVLLVGLWTAQGYVAGLPLDALTWLAFGLAATAAAWRAADE